MKMIAAMLLTGALLLSQPAFAGVVVGDAPAEKAPKAKKDKADKADKGAAGAEKKEEPKKEEKKAEKGGW
jgi:hypothetical protein